MRNIFIISAIVCGLSLNTWAQKLSLADKINPDYYQPRSSATLNIAFVDYGSEHTAAELAQIKVLLEERFYLATNKMLKLNVVLVQSIPYQFKIANYPKYKKGNITDPKRLQRLWYYDNVDANIMTEIYQNFRKINKASVVKKIDTIATITGAQFDGLGYAYGRVAVTESPREIAWGLPDGGYTDPVSPGRIVDELIHEIGHSLALDHAVEQCQADGMTYQEQLACCAKSESKDDVMSYCRNRSAVNDTDFFYGFKDCNLRNLKNRIIPALMSGGAWDIKNLEVCN